MLSAFVKDESGAISVDWTVMAAAAVGLGLASVTAVSTGTGSLGENIRASLSGASTASLRWAFASESVRQSFSDGDFTGWSQARQGDFGEWGAMQGPFGRDTDTEPLTYAVSLAEGNSNALIEFDMLIIDSWDGAADPNNPWANAQGDVMRLQINGQDIAVEPFVHREDHPGYRPGMFEDRSSSVTIDGATYNVSMTMTDAPTDNIGGAGWNDQRWRVQVEALDAPQNFELGFSSPVDQNINDEAWGIANFSVMEN